jgi:hypothetical protein
VREHHVVGIILVQENASLGLRARNHSLSQPGGVVPQFLICAGSYAITDGAE